MNSRDKILGRLKAAQPKSKIKLPSIPEDNSIFADYPDTAQLLEVFCQRFETLNGEVHIASSLNQMADILQKTLQAEQSPVCAFEDAPLINSLISENQYLADLFRQRPDIAIDAKSFADYAIGISTAELLIARTGSCLVISSKNGGRRLSVLPPIHIVLAKASQIVASLQDALVQLPLTDNNWSFATFITGPSRTSDIEKQLVLGAHGPKRLIAIILR